MKTTKYQHRLRRRTHRSGTVTVMVVVVILPLSGITVQYARRAVVDRRQAAQDLQERQTRELVSAGMRRAKQMHQRDASWSGETWLTSVNTESRRHEAEVVISVDSGTATVVARYPLDSPSTIQITQQAELEEP